MGTTATVAAKLAGADGRTIYICGLTARDGIVAARATTPVTGTRDGIIFPNTSRPTPRTRLIGICPSSIALLRKLVRQPSAFVGGIVLSTRMLQQ
jgi:hypothetical protein